ncbi:MAG: hypothetical protein JKX88_00335 [Marinicaulis sp.]|nr:hypothetical protein [Marinicaulis sp.]
MRGSWFDDESFRYDLEIIRRTPAAKSSGDRAFTILRLEKAYWIVNGWRRLMHVNDALLEKENNNGKSEENVNMFDVMHLHPRTFLFFWLNRRMDRRKPDESTEFYDGERNAYLSDDWRRTLDLMRRYEYPIDYEDL